MPATHKTGINLNFEPLTFINFLPITTLMFSLVEKSHSSLQEGKLQNRLSEDVTTEHVCFQTLLFIRSTGTAAGPNGGK